MFEFFVVVLKFVNNYVVKDSDYWDLVFSSCYFFSSGFVNFVYFFSMFWLIFCGSWSWGSSNWCWCWSFGSGWGFSSSWSSVVEGVNVSF